MILKGKGGIQYELQTPPFAQGGEGMIFNIKNQPGKVAKLYKQGKTTPDHERKLIKMVMSPPDKAVLDQIAWPLDVLYDNGQAVGFVMEKFKLKEDLNVIYEYGSSSKYPELPWENKIIIAKNLCAVLDAVHKAGHVCGDFNPKNISVDPQTGRITFVDTDSYHITDGSNVYRCNVGMPEYLPREIQVKMQMGLANAPLPTFSRETDHFALAIHIFQLLMNGCHPFACMPIPSADSVIFPDTSDSILKGECPFVANVPGKKIPRYAPPLNILPSEIQDMFKSAFTAGHVNPAARPSAEEWFYALDRLQKSLKKCRSVQHHEYYSGLSQCPWCEADARFASALSGANKPALAQTTYKPAAAPVRAPSAASVGYTTGSSSANYVGAQQYHSSNTGSYRKKGFSRKLRNGLVTTLVFALLAGGIYFGVTSIITNKKVGKVEKLVAKIPATVTEYSFFDKEITDAYNAYMKLDPSLQKKVENADLLLNCLDGFNAYKVEQIRNTLPEVNAESVKDTDILAQLHDLYANLNIEQKAQLKSEEYAALEQYAFTHLTIKGIQDLLSDVVGKYDTMSEIKVNYTKLKDEYKALVYNYGELETVDAAYTLQNALQFTEANGGWSVTVKEDSKTKLTGDIEIPESYKGQPVTTIPEKAFAGCSAVSSFTVPKSVTSIGKGAFSGCIKLQAITLPFVGTSRSSTGADGHFGRIFGSDSYTGGTGIEQYYGRYDSRDYYIPGQLKSVTITDAVQLSYGAFYNCSMLTEINLNNEIIAANEVVFCGCSSIKEINISGLTVISRALFSKCSSLERITLNDAVTEIQGYAFNGCMNLKSINSDVEGEFIIPNSVKSIGEGTFAGCIKLQAITLPFVGTSRSSTGADGHFGRIFGSDSYTGGTGIEQYYGRYDSRDYYIPAQLKSVTITDAVQLNYGAFYNCSMLTELKINSGAKNNVGEKVFNNCKSPKWT